MNKINAYILNFLFLVMPLFGIAQVEIDNNMILVGADSTRRIEGLGGSIDSTDIISAKEVQESSPIYNIASGINDLTLNLNPSVAKYTTGMVIFFKADNSNTDSTTISINGLPLKAIKINGRDLKAGDIQSGQIAYIQYNGIDFNLIGQESLTCPNGFVDVNDNYCIEINERAAQNFINAMTTCQSINSKICTWSEWYFACQKASLALVNMVNNFEIVDDTANHSHTLVGVGSGSCTSQTSSLGPATAYPFRCCFLKK